MPVSDARPLIVHLRVALIFLGFAVEVGHCEPVAKVLDRPKTVPAANGGVPLVAVLMRAHR